MSRDLTKDKYLTPQERQSFERFLTARLDTDTRNALVFLLLLKTGARVSEILLLKPSDIDPQSNSILITGLKRSRSRSIYIKRPLMLKLRKYLTTVTTERVFPISHITLRKLWYQYRPVEKKLHCLRHTYAMEVLKKTQNIKTVQTGLGHRAITSTMVYADHYSADEELKKAAL